MAYELLLDDLLTELSDAGINTAELNIIEEPLKRINDISEFVLDNQTSLDTPSNTNQLFSQATELKEESQHCWDSSYFII